MPWRASSYATQGMAVEKSGGNGRRRFLGKYLLPGRWQKTTFGKNTFPRMILSIIIPAYNAAPYIKRCMDSCLAQDLPESEYEIIIINDGSSDDTGKVVAEYAKSHACITLVNRPNGGVSSARNTGITMAKGEYIWFIDADDYITPHCLGRLTGEAQRDKLDMMWMKWVRVDEHGDRLPPFKDERQSEQTDIMTGDMFMRKVIGGCLFGWAFLLQKEFIDAHNLRFDPSIIFTEDTEFIPRALAAAKKVKLADETTYHYVWRDTNATNSYNSKKVDSLAHTIGTIIRLSREYPAQPYFRHLAGMHIMMYVRMISMPQYRNERHKLWQLTRQYKIGSIEYHGHGVRKIMATIFNLSPRLCLMISCLLKPR